MLDHTLSRIKGLREHAHPLAGCGGRGWGGGRAERKGAAPVRAAGDRATRCGPGPASRPRPQLAPADCGHVTPRANREGPTERGAASSRTTNTGRKQLSGRRRGVLAGPPQPGTPDGRPTAPPRSPPGRRGRKLTPGASPGAGTRPEGSKAAVLGPQGERGEEEALPASVPLFRPIPECFEAVDPEGSSASTGFRAQPPPTALTPSGCEIRGRWRLFAPQLG
ncbi:collagen alpha-1(XXVI) chain-like [Hyaena hyaena]|uniref:collagen alpha-1(XXVI) chain-like n=1 Tax=Hyaena hyaena TaxID=95912 RepID=UPI001920EC77|nr:collagen alpha-1(XXVI) chain-like [Hyaena hyaena]